MMVQMNDSPTVTHPRCGTVSITTGAFSPQSTLGREQHKPASYPDNSEHSWTTTCKHRLTLLWFQDPGQHATHTT